MKRIISNLQSQLDKIEDLVTRREDTYTSRSESWQDSEKGAEYYNKTEEIQEAAYFLTQSIEALEEIETYKT